MSDMANFDLSKLWGNRDFGSDYVGSVRQSGGLLCMWDSGSFEFCGSVKKRNFIVVKGRLKGHNESLCVVNVYAPQSTRAKQELWNDISAEMAVEEGLWLAAGDFNAVRFKEERRNSVFKPACASNFNSFIHHMDLMEYNMVGNQFTCVRANGRKLSKIDRFLVSSNLFNKWPEASVRALHNLHSDHRPLLLSLSALNYGHKPFRLFNSWLKKDGFDEVVRLAAASFSFEGDPDLFLNKKFAFIRSKIKSWRDEMVKKEGEEEKRVREELERLEEVMESRSLSEEEEWIYEEINKLLKELSYSKGEDLRQRARIKWAIDGDENSKYFHGVINKRKAANSIPGLSINGNWVTKPSKVKKEVMLFFKRKFVEDCDIRPFISCSGIKTLSNSKKELLIERFSREEIKLAVFSCGDDRAPGPDDGRINVGCGSSFITLIPKVKDPVELNNYRPINLVGIISKVISIVLANRLKLVISNVISDSQSAFLKDKFILDGPLIVNELITWCKKRKRQAFLLKIDFEKAYDNVNWSFVVDIMKQMGFPELWCRWIWGILKSARSSVLVNGSPTFEFKCEKGVRQGDPISPFIFLIVMEALTLLLDKAKDEGILRGLATPNDGPVISHLLFADDAIILGEWCSENVLNVVRILRVFHMCSGLRINLSKSNLYGLGVDGGDVEVKAASVGCKADFLPFRYLGIMVGANMSNVNNWKPVYDVFQARLSRWKANSLSIGGSSNEEKKIHWVAWDNVSIPKECGGLGLSKLKDTNLALLSKWCWRYKMEEKSLWRKVISAIHCGIRSWDFIPSKKNWGSTWSKTVKWITRSKVGDLPLRSFFKGVPGRGDSISFWLDPWVAIEPLKDLFPSLFQIEAVKKCRLSERLSTGSDQVNFCWQWKRSPIQGSETEDLHQLISLLESVSMSDRSDRWIWIGEGKDVFSVAAVKKTIIKGRGLSTDSNFKWCKWVPAKSNVLWNFVSKWCRVPQIFAFSVQDLLESYVTCGLKEPEKLIFQGVLIIACWSLWKVRNEARFRNVPVKIEKVISEVKALGFLWVKNRTKFKKLSWENWSTYREFLTFQTPTPSRSGVPSPNVRASNTPSRVDLTPKGVANNFLELRSLLNQYVSKERDKGVRIRLDYDEPEPSLSHGPPSLPFASSQPAVSRNEAGPSNPPPNPNPYLYTRSDPTSFPLFSSQPVATGAPLGHELTLDQLLQSPVTSLPPSATTTWEQALYVLPLARSAVMSTPLGVNCPVATGSLQGFNLMSQMMAQMMASFPWQHFINQVLATQGNNNNNNHTGARVEEDLAKPYKPSNLSCFS
ncbi:uncharacterized protein LOC110892858 [Helianthus annuus]|uniref:uncharacterized protein LOC110892858 n=1 Tax=Helianthus annuus TaxID=4232 RepID=UPI000B902100|nr:uncharacterized protein LOC110892858 [Helianthus annuus]